MMGNFNYMMGGGWGFTGIFWPFMAVLILWGLFWKGLALWHSARRVESWWFVILLLINTAGILEIIYLFAVAKLKFEELFTKKIG